MNDSLTVLDWSLCGFASLVVLLAIYTHLEGNRIRATHFIYQDIRRDLRNVPRYRILWRAISIAMGLAQRPGLQRRAVLPFRRTGSRQGAAH